MTLHHAGTVCRMKLSSMVYEAPNLCNIYLVLSLGHCLGIGYAHIAIIASKLSNQYYFKVSSGQMQNHWHLIQFDIDSIMNWLQNKDYMNLFKLAGYFITLFCLNSWLWLTVYMQLPIILYYFVFVLLSNSLFLCSCIVPLTTTNCIYVYIVFKIHVLECIVYV